MATAYYICTTSVDADVGFSIGHLCLICLILALHKSRMGEEKNLPRVWRYNGTVPGTIDLMRFCSGGAVITGLCLSRVSRAVVSCRFYCPDPWMQTAKL